mmetsp:Transcript_3461/g.5192  ORF Transcript_3461/g.5192 Transcript_3461/m.5192 type:complete len:324 (+) Transcript_3461:644-1615(+)
MGLTGDEIGEPEGGPVELHEFIARSHQDHLGDFAKSVGVVLRIDDLGAVLPEGVVNVLDDIRLHVILEGPGEASEGLPLVVDLVVERGHDGHQREDTNDLLAVGAVDGSRQPGGPASLGSSGDHPAGNVGNLQVVVDIRAGSPHNVVGSLGHGGVDHPGGVVFRIHHEFLPGPGHQRILVPALLNGIISEDGGAVGDLFHGYDDRAYLVRQLVSSHDHVVLVVGSLVVLFVAVAVDDGHGHIGEFQVAGHDNNCSVSPHVVDIWNLDAGSVHPRQSGHIQHMGATPHESEEGLVFNLVPVINTLSGVDIVVQPATLDGSQEEE